MGETFTAIIVDQFQRLRDGDRFWYQNIFSGDVLKEIHETTLADVIERNSEVSGLQDHVFFAPSVLQIDLADAGRKHVTIRERNGNLEVVDNKTQKVISSQSLEGIERLMLNSSRRESQQITIANLSSSLLPGGMVVESGRSQTDTLVVKGTNQSDSITVNASSLDISGLQIEYTGLERIVLQGMDANDTIAVAGGVEVDVSIIDHQDRDQHHERRGDQEHLMAKRDHQHPGQEPVRNVRLDSREPGNILLDQVFASSDLDQILDQPPKRRRR